MTTLSGLVACSLCSASSPAPAAIALCGTMIAAVYFHLASMGVHGFPSGHVSASLAHMLHPALTHTSAETLTGGAGPLSVD